MVKNCGISAVCENGGLNTIELAKSYRLNDILWNLTPCGRLSGYVKNPLRSKCEAFEESVILDYYYTFVSTTCVRKQSFDESFKLCQFICISHRSCAMKSVSYRYLARLAGLK